MLSIAQSIFSGAAPFQKAVFLLLAAAILLSSAVALIRPQTQSGRLARWIACLAVACPMLGVLCAATNGLHMMQTVVRLPVDVTSRMLAPGLSEMAAFVVLGATAGLTALVAELSLLRVALRHPAA